MSQNGVLLGHKAKNVCEMCVCFLRITLFFTILLLLTNAKELSL